MKTYDLVIIGGGASGLVCAGRAAALGLKTAVLEKSPRPGRKIMISGGGKCNVGNLSVNATNYISSNAKFCLSALARFAPDGMLRRLRERGIHLEEREHGQIFCVNSASDVLDYLLEEMKKQGASLFTATRAVKLKKVGELFITVAENEAEQSNEIHSSALVIAGGGPACPQCGASNEAMAFARGFGHRVIPPAPALVPLTMPDGWPLSDLAGISLPVKISLPQSKAPSFILPLLFTHRGISGPAALQISSYWQKGMPVNIDFLPNFDLNAAKEEQVRSGGKILLRNFLARHLPERLAERLAPQKSGGHKLADLSKKDWREAERLIHEHTAIPEGTEGWKKAEASRGGVDVAEVSSSTMESKITSRLFFCGEVLDVCGQLGGYNLHWAWASGYAAAEGAASVIRSMDKSF